MRTHQPDVLTQQRTSSIENPFFKLGTLSTFLCCQKSGTLFFSWEKGIQSPKYHSVCLLIYKRLPVSHKKTWQVALQQPTSTVKLHPTISPRKPLFFIVLPYTTWYIITLDGKYPLVHCQDHCEGESLGMGFSGSEWLTPCTGHRTGSPLCGLGWLGPWLVSESESLPCPSWAAHACYRKWEGELTLACMRVQRRPVNHILSL